MNQFKSGLSFIVLGLAFTPAAVYADSWSCTHDNVVREVKISYAGAGPVPCSVVYNKPDEGATSQVLWNAESEQGFCEEKAQSFVAKLESWGWACANLDAPSEPAEAVEVMPSAPVESAEPSE